MALELSELDQEISFERFGGGSAHLTSIAYDRITEEDLDRIVQLCNQEQIKKWVTYQYATGLSGEYTLEDAEYFIESSKQEWHAGTRSSYLVRNESNMIVGTIAIKSPQKDSAEVGYWADISQKGFMTNALNALVDVSKKEGFQELYTLIMPGNESSKNLSIRAGFKRQGEYVKNEGRMLFKFVRRLS